MKIRWLGNACVEIIKEEKNILFDPNFVVDPKKSPDVVFLSHEHDDHFNSQKLGEISKPEDLFAPKAALEKLGIKGNKITPSDVVSGVEVLECDCYGSEESVCFNFEGVLHTADTASFPIIEEAKIVFSACFQSHYEEYLEGAMRLDPDIVFPYHFDPEAEFDLAKGLRDKLRDNGIDSEILEVGELVEFET